MCSGTAIPGKRTTDESGKTLSAEAAVSTLSKAVIALNVTRCARICLLADFLRRSHLAGLDRGPAMGIVDPRMTNTELAGRRNSGYPTSGMGAFTTRWRR